MAIITLTEYFNEEFKTNLFEHMNNNDINENDFDTEVQSYLEYEMNSLNGQLDYDNCYDLFQVYGGIALVFQILKEVKHYVLDMTGEPYEDYDDLKKTMNTFRYMVCENNIPTWEDYTNSV